MALYSILPGDAALAHLEEEEQALHDAWEHPRVLFYTNSPCIILGRYNKLEDWVNADIAEADGVPVLRRLSGGGTVYHDNGTLCYSLIAPGKLLNEKRGAASHLEFFRSLLIMGLWRAGVCAERSRLSDLALNGRKISGNAARITKHGVVLHGTLLFTVDHHSMEKYLPIPPDRPGISHREFVTSMQNEGVAARRDDIMNNISAAIYDLLLSKR